MSRAGGLSTSALTGASSFTGGRVLAALLERGHPGTALVRPRLLTSGLVQRGARIVPTWTTAAEPSESRRMAPASWRSPTERPPGVWTLAGIARFVHTSTDIEPPLYRRRAEFFTKSRAFKIEKARRVLGYDPQVDCEEGLRSTATWYRDAGWA